MAINRIQERFEEFLFNQSLFWNAVCLQFELWVKSVAFSLILFLSSLMNINVVWSDLVWVRFTIECVNIRWRRTVLTVKWSNYVHVTLRVLADILVVLFQKTSLTFSCSSSIKCCNCTSNCGQWVYNSTCVTMATPLASHGCLKSAQQRDRTERNKNVINGSQFWLV